VLAQETALVPALPLDVAAEIEFNSDRREM